jgi:poly(A) polymerase/tRNA nucleotidyltransferase (CCA-adding enzyme)
LKRILAADDPRAAVGLMRDTGVLNLVMGEADVVSLDALIEKGAPVDALLRVAALLRGDIVAYTERWKLSGAEATRLQALVMSNRLPAEVSDADLRRALADESAEILIGRSWLDGNDLAAVRARLAGIARPVFPLQGRDVTALGVPEGPQVGEVLRDVHAWWMAGGCVADAQSCRAKAEERKAVLF